MTRHFESIDDFVLALDCYSGNNVWEDLIYSAQIKGEEVDREKGLKGNRNIHFKSGKVLLYSESDETWF